MRAKLPVALLSNADDDFLLPCLKHNGLSFPITVSLGDGAGLQAARCHLPHPDRRTSTCLRRTSFTSAIAGWRTSRARRTPACSAAWINRKPDATANRSIEVNSGDMGTVTFEPDFEIDSLDKLADILGLR